MVTILLFYCVRQLAATRPLGTSAHVLLIHHANELNTALGLYLAAVLVCPWHRTKTMLAEALQLFNVCELDTLPIDCEF